MMDKKWNVSLEILKFEYYVLAIDGTKSLTYLSFQLEKCQFCKSFLDIDYSVIYKI